MYRLYIIVFSLAFFLASASLAADENANILAALRELQESASQPSRPEGKVDAALSELFDSEVRRPFSSGETRGKTFPVAQKAKEGAVKGFAQFRAEADKIANGPHMVNNGEAERLSQKARPKAYSRQNAGGIELPVGMSVRSGEEAAPYDPLAPRKEVLPGGADHTLAHMDKTDAPEVTVRYEIGNGTSARIAINDENELSPLFTPRQRDKGLNSAGLYLEQEVDDDLQVHIGGHHRNLYGESLGNQQGPTDTGASVGFTLNF